MGGSICCRKKSEVKDTEAFWSGFMVTWERRVKATESWAREHSSDNIDSHVLAALFAGQRLPDASHPLSRLVLTIARGVDMPGKRGNGGSKTESHLPGSQSWQAVPPAAWPRPTLHTPTSFLRLCHFTLQTTDFKEGLAGCVLIAEWEWERLEAGS